MEERRKEGRKERKKEGKNKWHPLRVGLVRGDQAKLSTTATIKAADSVASLCQQGYDQGILLMPQPSLVSDLSSFDLSYSGQCTDKEARALYQVLVEALDTCARELTGTSTDAVDAKGAGGITCTVRFFGAQWLLSQLNN